ncbi:hypothetical protein SAMN02744133_105128 [Thalassospira xiamenensis M-5 = DSM 17429]|nr:hypothetical protein SAMN02744133_105128 [Thalassospira xiamenensis M-5 = DSM 17429]
MINNRKSAEIRPKTTFAPCARGQIEHQSVSFAFSQVLT